MAIWSGLGVSGSAAAGAAVSAVVVVGGIVGYQLQKSAPEIDPPPVAVMESAEEPAPEIETTSPAEDPIVEVEEAFPLFDIVRSGAGGDTLVAGRAAPGSEVGVLVDGQEMGRATADADGNFVSMFDMPGAEQPRLVTLSMNHEGEQTRSRESVIIAPTVTTGPRIASADTGSAPEVPGAGEAVDLAATDTGLEPMAAPDQVASVGDVPTRPEVGGPGLETSLEVATAAPDTAATPAPETMPTDAPTPGAVPTATPAAGAMPDTDPPAEPTAPQVMIASDTGIKVIQSGGAAPEVSTVVIDTISYDPAGEVELGGRGARDGFVRVYLDNKPILTTEIAADGQWEAALPEVDTGVYTLRVDEVNAAGNVTSRAETPFRREERTLLAELAPAAPRDGPSVLTVQPGNTLWGIASDQFGDGLLYVRVFDANRDRIRDPDLIYPGQVFEIPEG